MHCLHTLLSHSQLKHIWLQTNQSILNPLQQQLSDFPKDTGCNTGWALGHCQQKNILVKNFQFSSNHWSDLHNSASPNMIPHISRQTKEPTHKKGVCNTLNNSKPRASPAYSTLNGSWATFHLLLSLKIPNKRKRNHNKSTKKPKIQEFIITVLGT